MRREPSWRRYLRFWRPDVEADIDDEVRFHLEARVEALIETGMTADAARVQAVEEFGDPVAVRARLLAIDHRLRKRRERTIWWDALCQDARYAARGLRREPGFTAVVVLTLAAGIGVAGVMFGIVDRLLLRPPAHVRDVDRVARLYFHRTPWSSHEESHLVGTTYPDYVVVRDSARSFERVATFATTMTSLGHGVDARPIRQTIATASFFPLLGVRAERGRFFTDEEDRIGAGASVVVLGHSFWRVEFGGDTAALGKTLKLGSRSYTVIGVAPKGFTGVELAPVDVWLPMSSAAGTLVHGEWHRRRGGVFWLNVVVRLRPGATAEDANAEASRLFRQALAKDTRLRGGDASDSTGWAMLGPAVAERGPVSLGSLARTHVHRARIAKWLAGTAVAVLFIACGNVASLLLTRGARRRREIAVRVALGVSARRLAGQLVSEAVLLALLGSVFGLALAVWGGKLVGEILLPNVAWGAPLDQPMLAFAAVATLVTILLVAIPPAARASRAEVVRSLNAGLGGRTVRRSLTQRTLLVLQVAMSAVLLIGAGLFVRSFWTVTTMDMGHDSESVVVAHVNLAAVGFSGRQVAAFYRSARARVQALPGVEDAALTGGVPFYSNVLREVRIPGRDRSSSTRRDAYVPGVTSNYFPTLGVSIVRGRNFTTADTLGAPPVTIVSQRTARLVWSAEEALGKCITLGGDRGCRKVVGIAEDVPQSTIERLSVEQYYVPLAQETPGLSLALLVRAKGDPSTLIAPIRSELHRLGPNLPLARVNVLRSLIDPQVQPWRLGAAVLVTFGMLALAIAAVGLYGVMAYEVRQRTDEIGLRLALGAGGESVVGLLVRQAMQPVVVGVIIGGATALAASGRVKPLLFQTSPTDPVVFTAVIVTLLAVSAAATVIPARRATTVDPVVTMRAE